MTTGADSSPEATISLNRTPGLVPLAVAEPADPGRQALEGDPLAGQPDPPGQRLVLREQVEDGPVGGGDVGRVAGERRPAERALALAEQRPDVRRHEAGEVERPLVAAELRLAPDRVAVVEHLGAGVEEADHRLDVLGHRRAGPVGELVRLRRRVVRRVGQLDALRQVRQRVVRAGLVGDDVDRRRPGAAAPGRPSAALPTTPTVSARAVPLRGAGPARPRRPGSRRPRRGSGRATRRSQPGPVHVDDQAGAAVHGDRERLRAAHPAAAGGQRQRAGEGAAEPLGGHRGERLVGALEDALGADVDPRTGGHLPVHGQAERLQPAELRPGGPVADQVGVGQQHPRAPTRGCASRRPAGRTAPASSRRRAASVSVRTSAWYDGQSRAALPVPP